jgi:hypothetical protein
MLPGKLGFGGECQVRVVAGHDLPAQGVEQSIGKIPPGGGLQACPLTCHSHPFMIVRAGWDQTPKKGYMKARVRTPLRAEPQH